MKPSFILICTIVFLAPAIPQTSLKDEVILRHLKQVEWPLAYREQNTGLLDRILAPEFERIGFDGERSSKQEELERVRTTRPSYDSLRFDFTRLEVFPNGTAIISGVGTVKGRDAEGSYTMTYSSSNVLIKRGGQWQAISSHVSGRTLSRQK